MSDEIAYIRWIRDQCRPRPPVEVGPGDDAAVISADRGDPLLVTTDSVLDGVDFKLSEAGPRLAGRKAMAVSLSDIAAMGGRPTVAVATLAAARSTREEVLRDLFGGMKEVAEEFGAQIVGGDCSAWDGGLVITVTCLGQGRPILRSGAVVGDAICVTGTLGGSILGKHLRFTPRVREAQELHRRYLIHSMIDISDGLARDLHHILEASGVGAEIDGAAIPISDDARKLSRKTARDPLDHALGDGEDFELLFSLPEDEAQGLCEGPPEGLQVTRIGKIVQKGCSLNRAGKVTPLPPTGYVHEFR